MEFFFNDFAAKFEEAELPAGGVGKYWWTKGVYNSLDRSRMHKHALLSRVKNLKEINFMTCRQTA